MELLALVVKIFIMENEIKCPVCGKVGIPDYHKEDIVCPCCGTDLSIYRVIDQIPEETAHKNIWKPVAAVATVVAVALGLCLIFVKPSSTTTETTEVAMLKDSVATLNKQLSLVKKQSAEQNASYYTYTVRKGESLWAISRKFYGTGSKAEKIAKDNDITLSTTLLVGDTLKIR